MRIIRNPLRCLPVLFFIHGVLAALLIYLKVESSREDRLLTALKRRVELEAGSNASTVTVLQAAMHVTHDVISDGAFLFGKGKSVACDWLPPHLAILMSGEGACGSYSAVLARLLDYCGYTVRIGQMKVRGKYGGHIIVEAKVGARWVVLDPFYDLAFRRPDSSLAGFDDLRKGWSAFCSQAPPGYDTIYRYEAIPYTNWEKIPVRMPVLRKIMGFTMGERRTAEICLRMYFLRIYDLCFYASLFFFVLLNIYVYCGVRGTLPWQRAALRQMRYGNAAGYSGVIGVATDNPIPIRRA